MPFPSCAVVFTDRSVLSLPERLIAKDRSAALAGQLLRVVTAYVTEQPGADGRELHLDFACDALGMDPPEVVRHVIALSDEAPVQAYLDRVAPEIIAEPRIDDASPIRGLLTVALNAILYATSAGVEPELRAAPPRTSKLKQPSRRPRVSSDDVLFLPGAIEISHLRGYQALERLREGREILRRFMVCGHWRRPAKNWNDQSLRWIAPYWKGPDMAAIIERTDKLTP